MAKPRPCHVSLQFIPDDEVLQHINERDEVQTPGKTVDHTFIKDDVLAVYRGKVLSQVPGFPSWYNIKYTDDEAIYSYKLVEDYKENNLVIVVNDTITPV